MADKIEHRIIWTEDGLHWQAKCGICVWDGYRRHNTVDAGSDLRAHVAEHTEPTHTYHEIYILVNTIDGNLSAFDTVDTAKYFRDKYNGSPLHGPYEVRTIGVLNGSWVGA